MAGVEAYDFSARYYDPAIGRFYSMDPIFNPATSPYAYCNNNPVNMIDPSGMATVPAREPDMMNPFGDFSLDMNNWNLPIAPGQAAGSGPGLNSGTTQVYGTDVNYWYYTSSLQDASGNNFSTQDYAAGVASRAYLAFLSYASMAWNASQAVDLSGLDNCFYRMAYLEVAVKGTGYINFNLSGGVGLGFTSGYIFDGDGNEYIYLGYGLTSLGLSGSITKSEQSVELGWNTGGEMQFLLSGQGGWNEKSGNCFNEAGVGGAITTVYSVGFYRFYIWKK